MAGGGETSVRVPINLEIMNNSLTDIKKVLDSLSPNTKNFSALKNIVADMEKSAAAFAQKMSVPFRNKSQFTSAGKDLDKFMAQMEKFNQLRGGLQLGDFQVVDPASLQQLADLKKQLEDAQKEIIKIQEQTLQGLFNNADVSGALIAIDPDITKKSFEEVEAIVNDKVDEINDKIAKIGSENGKAIDIGNKLKDIVGKNFISADVLGEDVFNQFFKKNGAFKAGQQNPFVEYLTQAFDLTPDQVNKLKDQSAAQINSILNDTFKNGNRRFFQTQQKRANAAEKGSADLVNSQEVLAALQKVQAAFNTAGTQSEQYRQALTNLHNTMDKVTQSSQKQGQAALGTNYDAMTAAVQNYKASLESAQGSLMKLERQQATFNSLKAAITNFMGFTQVLSLVRKGVTDAAAHIKELDTVMNGISIVTDMSTADLWGQVDAYTQLAQKYGTTIKGAYEISQIYYQQGLKSNEVMTLTEETLKLSKISGLDYATTTDYMTTALRGFHMEMEEASRVVDVYSALAAHTAVSQQELAEAMTRTASSMEAVGSTFEQASAMIATMVAATRESASNIGSAMKSIASRYGELTKDPTKLMDSEGEEINFNKVDAALKSVGISMQTADHQFRSLTEVILELSDAWDTLDSRQQRYIATQFAGNRQQSRFLALVSNGEELRRNLETAENSEGTGTQQVEKALESLETKINRVQTAWQEFYTTIGVQDAWGNFLDGATQVLNTLNGLPKVFNKIPVLAINAIANVVNAVKSAGVGALSGISKLIVPHINAAMIAAQKASAEGGTLSGKSFVDNYNAALKGLQKGTGGNIASNIAMIGGAFSSLSLMINQSTVEAKRFAGVASGIGSGFQLGGGIAQLFMPGQRIQGLMNILSGAMGLISAFNVAIEDSAEKAARLQTEAETAKNTAIELKSKERDLNTLINKYNTLQEHRYDSEEAAQAFQEVMNEIGQKFPELVASMDDVGNVTLRVKEVESALTEARNASAEAAATAAKKEREYQEAHAKSEREIAVGKMDKITPAQGPLSGMSSSAISVLQSKFGVLGKGTENDTIWNIASKLVTNPFAYNLTTSNKNALESMMRGQQQAISEHWMQQYSGKTFTANQLIEISKEQNTPISQFANVLEEVGEDNSHNKLWQFNLSKLTDQYYNALLQVIIQSLQEGSEEKEILEEYSRTKNSPQDENFNNARKTFLDAKEKFKQDQSDANLQELISAYNNYNAAYDSLDDYFKTTYSDVATELTEYGTILKELGAGQDAINTSRRAEFRAQLAQLQQKKEYDFLSNTNLNSIITKYYEEQFEKNSNGQNAEQFFIENGRVDKELKNMQSIWDQLISNGLETLILDRINDPRFYSTPDEIFAGTNITKDTNGPLWDAIAKSLNSQIDLINERVNGYRQQLLSTDNAGITTTLNAIDVAIEQGTMKIDTIAEEQLYKMIGSYMQIVEEYGSDEMIINGGKFGIDLLTHMQQLPKDIQSAILNNTITSVEGIDKTLDLISQELSNESLTEKQRDYLTTVQNALKEMRSNLSENINLSLQAQLNGYSDKIDTAVSYASKAKNGVSTMADAEKIINYYNQFMPEGQELTFSNLKYSGRSFKLMNADSIIETAAQQLQQEMSETDTLLQQVNTSIGKKRENLSQFLSLATQSAGVERQLLVSILGKTKYNTFFTDNQFTGNAEELKTATTEALDAIDQNAASLTNYSNLLMAQLLGIQENAKSLGETIQNISSNPKKISSEDYNRLEELYPQLAQKIVKDVYGNYLLGYADLLEALMTDDAVIQSMTLEDRNAAIAQVKKLQQESSTYAALSNIIASPDDITEEMLAAYATALNTTTDQIRHLFTQKDNGHYRINSLQDFLGAEGAGMDLDEITGEYANKLREATTSIYNSFVNAFTNGEVQYVADTAENRDALRTLPEGIATFSQEYQKWIINTANLSTEEIIKALEYSDLTQEQKTKNIDSVLKAQQSKSFNTVFSTILKDTNNISQDTMQKLADILKISVEDLVNTDAFDFDKQNQTYKVQDRSYLKSILTTFAGNLSRSAYRSLEAQLYTLDNEFSGQAMSFLSNNNIKETDVADILNKSAEIYGEQILNMSDFINKTFIRDINNNLQFKDNASFKSMASKVLHLNDDQIAVALAARISKTISNFSSLTTDAINGFDSLDKANAVLQDIRTEYNVNFDDIFEYSQSLHKFVYTASGIALRVQQLKEQLESGAPEEEQKQINAQLTSLMSQFGQGIDITGYRNLEAGTIEWKAAREELIRNINNYNAAADAAGRMTLDIDLVNSAINGNLSDLQSIYKLLGKELSANDLTDIYREPVTSVLNAINTLEESSVGSLIDTTTATILELSGAINTTNSQIDGKFQITNINFDAIPEAYALLYDTLSASTATTAKELNDVAVKIAKSQMSKQQAGIELMSSAAEMTIDQFADIFSSLGIILDKNFLSNGQFGDYVKSLGGDSLQITDVNGLITYARTLGADLSDAFGTEKGKATLKSYADSMIEQGNSINERIMSIATELESAKNGDLINVADLLNNTIGSHFANIPGLQNGIIEINDNINTLIEALINQYGEYLSEYDKSVLRAIGEKRQAADLAKKNSASKALVENWDNASYEMIEAFASAFNYDINKILSDFTSNGDGTYKGIKNKSDFARVYMSDQYIQEMNRGIDNVIKDTFSSAISAGIASITDGQQRIAITDENRTVLDELYEAGAGEIDQATREFCIEVTENSINSFISIIQSATGLTQSEKTQYIAQLYSKLQENTTDALVNNMMGNYDNLGYELVTKLKDNKIINDILGTAIKFNETTQTHFLDIKQAYDLLIDISSVEGLDDTTFNNLKTQIITAYSSITPQALVESMISSRDNITEEMINNLEQNVEGLPEDFRAQLTSTGLGKYKMGTTLAIQLAKAAGIENIEQIFISELTSNLNNLSSGIINGFTDISSMQNIIDTINEYYGSELDIGLAFDYSEVTKSFFLSTNNMVKYATAIKQQMIAAGVNQEAIDGQMQMLLANLRDSIDFSDAFNFKDIDQNSRARSQAALSKQIRDYRQMMAQEGKQTRFTDKVIEALFSGGDAAVAAATGVYTELGKELSSEVAQQIYQYPLTKIIAGYENLNKSAGSILTEEAAALGEAAGYFKTQNIGGGFVRIISVEKDKLETALNMYYANLVASLDATTEQINEAVLSIWDERGRKEALGSDLLSKASGMTYRELGEGLINAGINLTADLLDQLIQSNVIEKIAGTDQVRVTDFNAFANYLGVTNKDSQNYRNLYKQYVDSNIELATQAQEDVANAMSALTGAKIGEKINLSNVFSGEGQRKYQIALEQYLSAFGDNFEGGILTITESTNLFEIAQHIGAIANDANIEITQAMLELSDAIQDAIKDFADAIASGINGGITNAGKADMISFAQRFKELNVTLDDNDFVSTQNGLKLTTEKAIELYNALQQLSDVNTEGIFDALKESLFARDNISDMTGVLGKIGELSQKITENQNKHGEAANKTNSALQKELDLYEQIARTSMSNPDSYKFMSRKLPDMHQGPVNFWQDTSTMLNTMLSSAESGYMAIEDFYAIVTSMQDIANATGETMYFMGYEIKQGTDAAAKLIEAGYGSFATAAGHAGEIDLSGLTNIGVNLKTSAKDMAKGVEDGIHQYAASQVQMLDAAINILETVVAMEGISDAIDSEGTNITLEDLFVNIETREVKENVANAVQGFLDVAKGNEQMEKYLENIKLSNMSMKEILDDMKDGKIDRQDITNDMVLGVATFIKTLNSSGGFEQLYNNPEDVFNTLQELTLKIPGLTIEWQQGDTTYQEINGRKIWKDKDGKVVGTNTTDFNEGYKQIRLKEIQEEIKAINKDRNTKNQIITANGEEYTIKIDNDNIILKYDTQSGKLKGPDGKLYNSAYESVLAQYRQKAQESDGEFGGVKYKDMQDWQIEVAYNLKPTITINGIDELKNAPDILARILKSGKSAEELKALSTEEQKIMFGAELELDETNINDLNKLLEDSKTLIKPKIAPVNPEDIKINGPIHVDLIADSIKYEDNSLTFKTPNGKTVSIQSGSNLFEAMAAQMGRTELTDAEKAEIYESLPTAAQQRYTPEGDEWTSTAGATYAQELLSLVNAGKELNAAQRAAYLGYEKTLKNAIDIAETTDWKAEAASAKERTEKDREAWEAAHPNSRLEYNYQTDSAWYTKAFGKNANGQSLVDKFYQAFENKEGDEALAKWQAERWNDAKNTAGSKASNEEISAIYHRMIADAAIQYEKTLSTDSTKAPTAAESAQALSNAAAQQTLAAATLNAAAQALLGSTGDIGVALQQAGIDKEKIQSWIDSKAIDETYGKALIAAIQKSQEFTETEKSYADKNNELLAKNDALSKENASLQMQLTAAIQDANNLQAKITELSAAKAATEEEKTQLVAQLATANEQIQQLMTQATNYENQIRDLQGEKDELTDNLSSLQATLESTRSSLENTLRQLHEQKTSEGGEQPDQTGLSGTSELPTFTSNQSRLVFETASIETKAFEELSSKPITPSVEPDVTGAVESINKLSEIVIEPEVKPDTGRAAAQIKSDLKTEVPVTVRITYMNSNSGGGLINNSAGGTDLFKPRAKGNVALAAGTRTLMGELGPELVVSNGRYFIVGENGAEFVNLDKDAIVFNHLQTQRLLANGSTGRGKAITNEHNATSMATGNVSGPAKASAAAVLEQLRQVRALWEAMANASLSDLAKKGGGGGGGGGNKEIPGFIRDVERWYNWLQKIADLEKQITYQEQLRSKIQSDMVSSGDAYFKSQRKTYQDARDSALTSESLFLSQKEYFNKRRQQLNNSPLSELYTFDESGQLHFQDGSYEWLANLFKTDDYGNLKMSPKQQYQAIIKRNRNFAQYMRYDDSGKKINRKDYKSDDEYYVAMVKAFSDRMDAEKEEMQELFDSWNDQQKAVLEQMQAMNEQLQAMKDNQKEVEEAVIGAIEEMREREIDEMQNTRDALEKTNQNFIDGLSNQLNKEREMYQNNQNDQELQRNRRQLAILQRSGASASQIAQMQQKIDKQSQDQYFEKQQEQIDAVKEASDNQIEKLDTQIELAQEQLEFEKAHGLLWGQVYEVMARTPQEITDFIKENTEEFWGKSPLANSEDLDNTLFQATQWVAFRDDIEMQNAAMGRIDQNLDIFMGALEQIYGKQANWDKIKKESEAKYKEYWGIDDEDPNATAWDAYPGKNDDIAAHTTNTMGVDTSATTKSGSSSSSGGRTGLENKWYHNDKTHWKRLWNNGSWSKTQEGSHSLVTTGSKKTANGTYQGKKVEYYTVTKKCNVCGYTTNVQEIRPITGGGGGGASGGTTIEKPYAEGGVNDYTGLAMLHGTPTKPEGILNAEDYKAWKEDIKTTNLLYNALATVSTTQRNAAAAANSIGSQNAGVNIENAVVNMNTTIANDYDARRAGEQALEQMLTIARKSGTRSAQRR